MFDKNQETKLIDIANLANVYVYNSANCISNYITDYVIFDEYSKTFYDINKNEQINDVNFKDARQENFYLSVVNTYHNKIMRSVVRVISDLSYPKGFIYFGADGINASEFCYSPRTRMYWDMLALGSIPIEAAKPGEHKTDNCIVVSDKFYPQEGWYYNRGGGLYTNILYAKVEDKDILEILDFISFMCNYNESYTKYLLGWLAFRIQNPGALVSNCAVYIESAADSNCFIFIILRLLGRHVYNFNCVYETDIEFCHFEETSSLFFYKLDCANFSGGLGKELDDFFSKTNETKLTRRSGNILFIGSIIRKNKRILYNRIFYLFSKQEKAPDEYYSAIKNYMLDIDNIKKLLTFLYDYDWTKSGYSPKLLLM